MNETAPRMAPALFRVAAVDLVLTLLVVVPFDLALHGGTPRRDLEQLSLTAVAVLFAPIVDVIRTGIRWRRTDAFAVRTGVRRAIKEGHLPSDADPDTWTRPLVDRQQLVHRGPWVFAGGIAAVVVAAVISSRHGRHDPIVLAALAIELAGFLVGLVVAVRDRVGPRARVLADLLTELDTRVAAAEPARSR